MDSTQKETENTGTGGFLDDDDEDQLLYETETGEDFLDDGMGLELHPENDLDLQPDV